MNYKFINFRVGKFIDNFLYFSSYKHCGLYKPESLGRGVYEKCEVLCLTERIMPYNFIFEIAGSVFAFPFWIRLCFKI